MNIYDDQMKIYAKDEVVLPLAVVWGRTESPLCISVGLVFQPLWSCIIFFNSVLGHDKAKLHEVCMGTMMQIIYKRCKNKHRYRVRRSLIKYGGAGRVYSFALILYVALLTESSCSRPYIRGVL